MEPPRAKKSRRGAQRTRDPGHPAPVPASAAVEAPRFESTPAVLGGESRGQEAGADGGVDRISGLPDAILGEIVSLLSTKEAARTQTLATRWRHVWRAAPLVLDGIDLAAKDLPAGVEILRAADEALAGVVSLILAAHPGPARRFCIPPRHLHDRPAAVDAWLRSQALDNLEELDFCDYWQLRSFPPAPPPASAFRFSDTLRVATFSKCKLMDRSVEGLQFPHLKQLALEDVSISEGSLHAMISSCPALECLLLNHSFGFSCVRISSSSLRSIGLGASRCGNQIQLREFIIIDAPCLERLLFLRQSVAVNVSVIRAPKLETLGCLTVINLTTAVRNVKILAVAPWPINLDMAIDLLKCFPCLEKLYIKSFISGEMNRWHRKHRQFIKCFDIRLKTIVLELYRGIRSQVNFASFFLLNASKLELMTFAVENRADNDAFFAEQYRVLQMEKRASRSARLHFRTERCNRAVHVIHVRDLAVANPFECRCWH
ncbi:hypothetical protein PAHAL_2G098300 [Panicum hallii]|uniref:Uncharacterized protein n=1 Tax=Panicum hallii TaxID=206008 RepID=A0A2S3GXC8_9POAL|nr:putative F-box/FBD/LRR-repeat protein At5g44950 [Panicum hallii]PAN10517.1 hypothetical protein PAHAL_2G098300 [Panicum hallii]